MTDQHSTNDRAKELMGKRPTNCIPINQPIELCYHCPICLNQWIDWSEYNGFLWCPSCDIDIPSCLCHTDVRQGINTFLSTVEDAINRSKHPRITAPTPASPQEQQT